VVANAIATLLVVRQLALIPKYNRRPGPKPGALFQGWQLMSSDGELRSAEQMPSEYVSLFTDERCGPCHALFGELAHVGRIPERLVVISRSGGNGLLAAAATGSEVLYDEFLVGAGTQFFERFEIPSTPFATAVRHGHVIASAPTRTAAELDALAARLRPAIREETAQFAPPATR